MNEAYKEVYFNKYCATCEHFDLPESEKPCNECLSNPANEYSHKPVNYKETTKKKKVTE